MTRREDGTPLSSQLAGVSRGTCHVVGLKSLYSCQVVKNSLSADGGVPAVSAQQYWNRALV